MDCRGWMSWGIQVCKYYDTLIKRECISCIVYSEGIKN